MTRKHKKSISAKKGEKGLTVVGLPGESREQAIARTMISPTLQSAATINEYVNSPVDLDLQAIIDCLEKEVSLVKNGNFDSIEQMMLVQAYTLDVIANNLFRRSKNQEYLNQLEVHLKLGLRAQSQSRANLEALVNMKTPKTRLNQTNIAHNQQINNSLRNENWPNELLEKTDGERLDGETPQEAVRVNPELATVGEQHRAKDN